MPAVGALKEVPVASGVLLTEGLDADPPTVVVVVEGAVLEVLMVMGVLAVSVPVVVPGSAGGVGVCGCSGLGFRCCGCCGRLGGCVYCVG